MAVWDIYYNHWAKECNKKKKQSFTKKCANKLLLAIFRIFFFVDVDLFLWNQKKIREELIDSVRFTLKNVGEVDKRKILRELASILYPFNDELSFPRTMGRIQRFEKNTNLDCWMTQDLGVDLEDAHRLDALLCLM